jgi:hypothetical protein
MAGGLGCAEFVALASQVNGKKLHPARGTFASFLLPLLAWWLVALIIYGVSFQKVAMLQAPLTSMQVRGPYNETNVVATTRMVTFGLCCLD